MVNHFADYTLTTGDLKLAASLFSAIFIAVGSIAVVSFSDIKKRAWIISLFNSFVTMIAGAVYLVNKIPQYPEFLAFEASPGAGFHTKLDNFCVLACIWFFIACFFDLFFGVIFYRKQLQLLTAYIHHGVFMWMMVTGITGNGIFLTCVPFAPSFVYMLVEEIPTFLLALGSVFPYFRSDYGFGVSFFFLRLVYHAYGVAYAVKDKTETVVVVLYFQALLLHLNWFYGWVKMMLKPKKVKKEI